MRKIDRQDNLKSLASIPEENVDKNITIDNNFSKAKDVVKSMAVIRSNELSKVKTAICDLVRYAHLTFADKPKTLEPAFADNILTHVMKNPLKVHSEAASIVSLVDEAPVVIGRLRKIHPPAHVIIVSPRYEIFHKLVEYTRTLPELDLTIEFDMVYENTGERIASDVQQ